MGEEELDCPSFLPWELYDIELLFSTSILSDTCITNNISLTLTYNIISYYINEVEIQLKWYKIQWLKPDQRNLSVLSKQEMYLYSQFSIVKLSMYILVVRLQLSLVSIHQLNERAVALYHVNQAFIRGNDYWMYCYIHSPDFVIFSMLS